MMSDMRTTLTLDPDVARLVEEAMHRHRKSMKRVVNDAIRKALAGAVAEDKEPYRVIPHHTELRPGYDHSSLNRLADELEDEEILEKLRRST